MALFEAGDGGGVLEGQADLVEAADEVGLAPGSSGWFAVDGDAGTAWVGNADTNLWWLALTYEPALTLTDVVTTFGVNSATNIHYLYSVDGANWIDLDTKDEAVPVSVRHLWMIFSMTNTASAPVVLDVAPK